MLVSCKKSTAKCFTKTTDICLMNLNGYLITNY